MLTVKYKSESWKRTFRHSDEGVSDTLSVTYVYTKTKDVLRPGQQHHPLTQNVLTSQPGRSNNAFLTRHLEGICVIFAGLKGFLDLTVIRDRKTMKLILFKSKENAAFEQVLTLQRKMGRLGFGEEGEDEGTRVIECVEGKGRAVMRKRRVKTAV